MAWTEQSAIGAQTPKSRSKMNAHLNDGEAADLADAYGPRFATLVADCAVFDTVRLSLDTNMTFASPHFSIWARGLSSPSL